MGAFKYPQKQIPVKRGKTQKPNLAPTNSPTNEPTNSENEFANEFALRNQTKKPKKRQNRSLLRLWFSNLEYVKK
jgi:hypothetical protein